MHAYTYKKNLLYAMNEWMTMNDMCRWVHHVEPRRQWCRHDTIWCLNKLAMIGWFLYLWELCIYDYYSVFNNIRWSQIMRFTYGSMCMCRHSESFRRESFYFRQKKQENHSHIIWVGRPMANDKYSYKRKQCLWVLSRYSNWKSLILIK